MAMRYFVGDREISPDQALTPAGEVRDGVRVVTGGFTFMDAASHFFPDGRLRRAPRDDDDDDEDDDDHETAADGFLRVTDGYGKVGLALHRPGFRVLNDAAGDHAKRAAYAAADHLARNAWRDAGDPLASVTGQGSGWMQGAREGDVCTVQNIEFPLDYGSPGQVRLYKGKLVCVPDRPRRKDSLSDMRAAKELAYDAYQRRVQRAYLNEPDDDDDDVEAAVRSTETHTESAMRTDSLADLRKHHRRVTDTAYNSYDAELRAAYKNGG